VPSPDGTISAISSERLVGVWVMPDNRSSGILEDFIRFLVPCGDILFSRVCDFVQGLREEERRFTPARLPKAEIHAWLALQEEPGKPLGQAVTAKYLDAECAMAGQFASWLRRLFV
jgi:hypothetical protein